MPTAAILLSRQPKHPHGGLMWVRQAVAAVRHAGSSGYTIITSNGMSTWELILAAARIHDVPVRMILDQRTGELSTTIEITRQFELPETTEFVTLDATLPGGKERLHQRDRKVISMADLLLPISIRSGGAMAALIAEADTQGKTVDRRFMVPYVERDEPLAYVVPRHALTNKAGQIGSDYLTHWTRASTDHWLDERALEYYRAIIGSSSYPRTAFHTLAHILSTRRLIGSRRHMPRNTATVAFTGLRIEQVLPRMRWRAKYAEMAFEPYGIGIRRDVATSLGIYPVQYYDPEVAYACCDIEPWLTQSIGQKTDWRQECEYRHKGDLDLRLVPDEALLAFVPSQKEAAALESAAGIQCVSLFE